MSKRTRTMAGFGQSPAIFQRSQKRPIDKDLIYVLQSLNTTQQQTVLKTTTFPCTITGIRWNMAISASATAGNVVRWAIVLVKEGLSASTIAASDGASFYEPEQNVLAFGVHAVTDADLGGGPSALNFEGSTKTMRKLMGGDQIMLISDANATQNALQGCVQFFCKS